MVGDAALGSQRSRVRVRIPPPLLGGNFGVILNHFGVILGSSWCHFGVTLGSSWGHLGVILGSFWDQFGINLESFWDHFGIMLGSIWDQFGIMLGSFPAVRTGRSPERGGRQNGQTLARTAPARSAPARKPDWRSRQVGQNARTARTPERQNDNSLPGITEDH